MSQTRPGSEPPPEVPDEFGAAYRAAYERALHDQTDGPRHRRPPQYRPGYPLTEPVVETVAERPGPGAPVRTVAGPAPQAPSDGAGLPERRGRLVVGTHRVDTEVTDQEGWFGRVRDSRLFVPALLLALALLLVLGAYVLGRAFTAAVGA